MYAVIEEMFARADKAKEEIAALQNVMEANSTKQVDVPGAGGFFIKRVDVKASPSSYPELQTRVCLLNAANVNSSQFSPEEFAKIARAYLEFIGELEPAKAEE